MSIIRIMKQIFNKIYIKLYVNSSNKRKKEYLIKNGAEIGEGTRFNGSVFDFGTEPYLISCGKDCLFAAKTQFITHDGGIKVLNSLGFFGGQRMDKMQRISVGNNVYTGIGAIIMPGVSIGDNCIIGAGAVVTKDIPSDSVAVGVPAKVIFSIEEYARHCQERGCLYPTPGMPYKKKKEFLIKHVPRNKSL